MRGVVLLLPLVLALPACGSDGDGGAASDAPAPASATAAGAQDPSPAVAGAATRAPQQSASTATPAPAATGATVPPAPAPTRVAVAAPAGAVPMPGQVQLPSESELATLPPPAPGGGSTPAPNPCALVPAGALAVLVPGATGSATQEGSSAYSRAGCVWGSIGDERILSLQVLTPGQLTDPGAALVPSAGAVAAPTPPGGNLWGTAQISGIAAPGITYGWTANGKQVVLTYLGPVDDAARAATLDAARSAAAALGG